MYKLFEFFLKISMLLCNKKYLNHEISNQNLSNQER